MTDSLKIIFKDIGFKEVSGDLIGTFYDEQNDSVFEVEAKEGTDPTNGLREYRICTVDKDGKCDVDNSLSLGQFLEDIDRHNIWWIPPVPSTTVRLHVDLEMSPEDVPLDDWASYVDDAGGNVSEAVKTAARRKLGGLIVNDPNVSIVE